jgi:hypothetical protein
MNAPKCDDHGNANGEASNQKQASPLGYLWPIWLVYVFTDNSGSPEVGQCRPQSHEGSGKRNGKYQECQEYSNLGCSLSG